MSGIFNLFGGLQAPVDRAPTQLGCAEVPRKPILRPGGPGGTPMKLFQPTGGKPKGLSLRPASDSNIRSRSCSPSALKKDQKQQELLKPKVTQLDTSGRPISPRSKNAVSKIKNLKPIPMKALSPKLKSPNYSQAKQLSDDNIFKKPLPPKVINNKYPEPEKLAYSYNEEEEYYKTCEKSLDEIAKLLAATHNPVRPYEDEGFESDPEMMSPPKLPSIGISGAVYNDDMASEYTLELPELSDDDF